MMGMMIINIVMIFHIIHDNLYKTCLEIKVIYTFNYLDKYNQHSNNDKQIVY